jgi:hypothetical protein
MPTSAVSLQDLSTASTRAILALRLLIARAANSDSLRWWDDESLTDPAGYLLDRLFPTAPALAGRSLALRAAQARHQAACSQEGLHLYRLDPQGHDQLALRFVSPLSVGVPEAPIRSIEELRAHLNKLTKTAQPYAEVRRTTSDGLLVEVPPSGGEVHPLLHRARTLAWAYLEGAPGKPVFPYCME